MSSTLGSYDEQVMAWRANLKEMECRGMAAEYLRGIRTPDNVDAYEEYLFRGYDQEESLPPSRRGKSKKRSKR